MLAETSNVLMSPQAFKASMLAPGLRVSSDLPSWPDLSAEGPSNAV